MSRLIHTVAVVVPAHNEQDLIADCLTSIRLAQDHLSRAVLDPPLIRVVVVLDSCTDGTREVLLGFPEVEQVRVAARRVGTARARGADRVLRTAGVAPRRIWLANTDADSRVPDNWLAAMVREAERGTHVVLGTAVPDVELPRRMALAWDAAHRGRDDHAHVYGANLGLRGDAYLSLGGFRDLATDEDVSLAALAVSAPHLRTVRSGAFPVLTSARETGRAPGGFAAYLAELAG